jgi:hypothetical protein
MAKPPDNQDCAPHKDYVVGYGKPPVHSRFKDGQSGNPRGRPKTSKNRTTIINQALNERVVVTDKGRRKTITKQEAVFKQLVNRAAGGDHRAVQLLLAEIREIEARIAATPNGREVIEENDQQVFQNFLKRIQSQGDDNGNGGNSNRS